MKRRDFLQTVTGAACAWPAAAAIAGAAGTKKKIKIGQIGTAHAHAGGKLATLRKLTDQYEVVGVVEPDPARRRAAEAQKTYQGLKWLTEDELLGTKGLEAVAVETAVRDLVHTAQRAVAAGMHLHLDKPAGESLGELKKLLAAASSQKRIVQMGYMFRGNPAFQFCFEAVRQGWLGEVFELHGVISKTVGAAARKRLAEYDGGSMFELGCHLIDAMVAVLGKPERVTPFVRRTHPEQDTLADNILAAFEYPKATATIRSSLIEVDGGRRRQFVVCGDRGTIVIRPLEPPRLSLTLAEAQGPWKKGTQEVPLPRMPGRYDAELVTLAQAIRGEREFPYPPAHDLAVHEAILLGSGLPLG